jgi:hypothetical protein
MYALINLFVYILSKPGHSRVKSDLAIMDIGAGHFAQLEYHTDGEVTMPFTKEIAALARVAASRAKEEPISSSALKNSANSQSMLNDHVAWARPEETAQLDHDLDNDNGFTVSHIPTQSLV